MFANAREAVGDLSLYAGRITDTICREQGKFQLTRKFNHRVIARLFVTIEMALQFGINIFATEDVD